MEKNWIKELENNLIRINRGIASRRENIDKEIQELRKSEKEREKLIQELGEEYNNIGF
jgi:site-specific DNA-adenine methylase